MPQICFIILKMYQLKKNLQKLCISQSYDIKYHFVIKVSDLNVLRLKWNLCGLSPSQLFCLSSWHFFLIWSYYALDCYLYILFSLCCLYFMVFFLHSLAFVFCFHCSRPRQSLTWFFLLSDWVSSSCLLFELFHVVVFFPCRCLALLYVVTNTVCVYV